MISENTRKVGRNARRFLSVANQYVGAARGPTTLEAKTNLRMVLKQDLMRYFRTKLHSDNPVDLSHTKEREVLEAIIPNFAVKLVVRSLLRPNVTS